MVVRGLPWGARAGRFDRGSAATVAVSPAVSQAVEASRTVGAALAVGKRTSPPNAAPREHARMDVARECRH